MKISSKTIIISVIAAISIGSVTVSAVSHAAKNGKLPFGKAKFKAEMKAQLSDEEEKTEMLEKHKEKLTEKLEAGEITTEEYDKAILAIENGTYKPERNMAEKPAMPEFTEEEKAARLEVLKAELADELESGKISQEDYDEALSSIEAGEFMPPKGDGRDKKGEKPELGEKPERPELSDEEKAAMLEKHEKMLSEMLDAGKISQEEYDKAVSDIESGNLVPQRPGGKDMKGSRPAPGNNKNEAVE